MSVTSPVAAAPTSDIDLHTDAALLDPYPLFKELRDLGGAVWMSRYGMFALSRYEDIRAALGDWESFSSAGGVTFNERMNETLKGITLHTDPPEHREMRGVLRRPLSAAALRDLEAELNAEADKVVAALVERGSFDAVGELARHLPVTIISKYVGLPPDGRENMLKWGAASFDCFGPLDKERTQAAFPIVGEEMEYLATQAVPGKLTPDGWGQRLFDAAADGDIAPEKCPVMLVDYVNPSLDTTIHAISSGIWLFGKHPDQWELVRDDPSLIPGAVNEIVRIESPVTGFTRSLTRAYEVDGVTMPAGSRVMMLYASGNRDERRWEDPERFDIRREGVAKQIGWGFGEHACVGMGLARLEMKSIFSALARRVRTFEVGEVERDYNMVLRGLKRLDVSVVPR
ncbi:MAG: cytochrome P450 [Solirubrobacterales bacterium]